MFSALEYDHSTFGTAHCTHQAQTLAYAYLADSVNLNLQTRLSDLWLAYGQMRWVNYSEMEVTPSAITTTVQGYEPTIWFENDIYTLMTGLEYRLTDTVNLGFDVTDKEQIEGNISWFDTTTRRARLGVHASCAIPQTTLQITGGIGVTQFDGGQNVNMLKWRRGTEMVSDIFAGQTGTDAMIRRGDTF